MLEQVTAEAVTRHAVLSAELVAASMLTVWQPALSPWLPLLLQGAVASTC
jgi:hypothetical protein